MKRRILHSNIKGYEGWCRPVKGDYVRSGNSGMFIGVRKPWWSPMWLEHGQPFAGRVVGDLVIPVFKAETQYSKFGGTRPAPKIYSDPVPPRRPERAEESPRVWADTVPASWSRSDVDSRPKFESGGGGSFAGAGASGSWDDLTPERQRVSLTAATLLAASSIPDPTPAPAYEDCRRDSYVSETPAPSSDHSSGGSSYSSESSSSSGSDSSSSSSSSDSSSSSSSSSD